VTSEAQRLANRRSAQKSTGPRSAEGKARTSRNALRHGLTAPLSADPAAQAAADAAAATLVALGVPPTAAALRVGELVVHLARIRQAKQAAIARARAARPATHTSDAARDADEAAAICAALPELLTLDGYARKAQSRLRRVLREL
jgi:hypothetical protein